MKRHQLVITSVTLMLCAAITSAQWSAAPRSVADLAQSAVESLVTVSVVKEGQAVPVGAGLVVRSDGVIAVAAHLVKDATEIQIKLRNGEVYDHAQRILADERRNIAFLCVPVVNLRTLSYSTAEEGLVGSRVVAVYGAGGKLEATESILNAVVLADEIPGAGEGYRVLKISRPLPDGASGVLVNERGAALGLLAAKPKSYQSYAVPLSGLIGHIAQIDAQTASGVSVSSSGGGYYTTYPRPAASPTPVPIAQTSVSVPERGVLSLDPKGPGSVVIKAATPADILAQSKTIYVQSWTDSFKAEQLVNELNKRKELAEWGLSFVDERETADLVLTLDHVLFTWKYTFKLAHQRTSVVVATGDVIIWDGNLGAPSMAKRVIEKLTKVRSAMKKPEEKPADKPKDNKQEDKKSS